MLLSLAGWVSCLAVFPSSPTAGQAAERDPATAALLAIPARAWAEQAAKKEIEIINHDGSFIRYRQRTIDSRRDELREVIESKDGTVARLLMRNNRPLTPEEDEAERSRLNGLIEHPSEFQKHVSRDENGKKQAIALIRLMPQAMIYTYAPDQTPTQTAEQTPGQTPVPAGVGGPQVVIDYAPNPKFNPPTTESEALSGLRGRVWIDANAKTIVRMTAEVFQPVNFGWGILAHVYPGGKLDVEQADALGGRWNMTSFHEQVTVKALMVKTIAVDSEVHSFDFQQLPGPMGYQNAIKLLLAESPPK